jgi:hypothetical protein
MMCASVGVTMLVLWTLGLIFLIWWNGEVLQHRALKH